MATWTKIAGGAWGIRMVGTEGRAAVAGRDVRVWRTDGTSAVRRIASIVVRLRTGVVLASVEPEVAPVAPQANPTTTRPPAREVAPVRKHEPAFIRERGFRPDGTSYVLGEESERVERPAPSVTVSALLGGYDDDDGPVAVMERPETDTADDGTFSLDQYEDTAPVEPEAPAVEPTPTPEPVPAEETTITVDESIVASTRPHLFVYDIPDRAEITNPSGELYGRAVRINLSCWVVAEGDIPWNLLNRLNTAGATAYVVPFDPRGAKTLVTMMTDALRKEIADALRRCERSARLVEERIAAAGETSLTPDEADEWTRKRAEDVANRMGVLLENMETAATRFGIPASILNARHALTTANAIGSAMNARAAVYAEAVRVARQSTDYGIANAAEADAIPPTILADALDDAGQHGTADALRAAFDTGS